MLLVIHHKTFARIFMNLWILKSEILVALAQSRKVKVALVKIIVVISSGENDRQKVSKPFICIIETYIIWGINFYTRKLWG